MRWKPVHSWPFSTSLTARVDGGIEAAEALGHRLDALVAHARGRVELLGLLDVAGADGVGERLRGRPQRDDLVAHVTVVTPHGGVELRVGLRLLGLPGDDEDALGRALAAERHVAAGLEVERERTRQPVGDVLLLAQDLRALLDLELRRLVAALVRDLERGRAGRASTAWPARSRCSSARSTPSCRPWRRRCRRTQQAGARPRRRPSPARGASRRRGRLPGRGPRAGPLRPEHVGEHGNRVEQVDQRPRPRWAGAGGRACR